MKSKAIKKKMTKEPKNSQNIVMFTARWFRLLSSISSWSLSAWVFDLSVSNKRVMKLTLASRHGSEDAEVEADSPSLLLSLLPSLSLLVVDMKAIRMMWRRLSQGTQALQAQRSFSPHGKEAELASGKAEPKKSGLWFQQKNRPTLMAINSHRLKYHFPSTRTQWEGHVAPIWKK